MPPGIDDAGLRTAQGRHLRVAANGGERAVLHREGGRLWTLRVQGNDCGVGHHQICRRLLRRRGARHDDGGHSDTDPA